MKIRSKKYKVIWSQIELDHQYDPNGVRYYKASKQFDSFDTAISFWYDVKTGKYENLYGTLFNPHIVRIIETDLSPNEQIQVESYINDVNRKSI